MATKKSSSSTSSLVSTNSTQNSDGPPTDSSNNVSKNNKRTLLYIIIIGIAIIGLIVVVVSFTNTGASIQSIGTTSGTPEYISTSQSAALIGNISNYQTLDLFNFTNPLNITYLEAISPFVANNVTEGWGTFIAGENKNNNASALFFIVNSYNTSKLAKNMAYNASLLLNTTPVLSTGTLRGFNYTYLSYKNSTMNIQIISGWKNTYGAFAILTSNPNFSANVTTFITILANDTP